MLDPCPEKQQIEKTIQYLLIAILSTESGRYDVSDLSKLVKERLTCATEADVEKVINDLLASSALIRNAEGKISSTARLKLPVTDPETNRKPMVGDTPPSTEATKANPC